MSENIADLRQTLFNVIKGVRDGSIDLEKAKMVNELSKTIVDTAKVEVDFIKATDADGSGFLEYGEELPGAEKPGYLGRTTHRIR
jgi:hypothetical protein